jgi:hypothetical protein
VIQRPEKERVLELANRQKYSQPSYRQQPQSCLVSGDFKQAILLACALINVPEAKMPYRDEESEEPESPTSQEPEPKVVQLRNEKSQCKHVCSGGRNRDGKPCKHRCCRKGLSKARKHSSTQYMKRNRPSVSAIE